MFLLLLLLTIVLVGVVVMMPYLTNLVSYQYEKKPTKPQKTRVRNEYNSRYVPPDQQVEQTEAKSSGIRKITAEDVPIKLKLNNTQVKRRKERLDTDSNPNNYDYDLDELINEVEDEPVTQPTKPPVKFTKDIV